VSNVSQTLPCHAAAKWRLVTMATSSKSRCFHIPVGSKLSVVLRPIVLSSTVAMRTASPPSHVKKLLTFHEDGLPWPRFPLPIIERRGEGSVVVNSYRHTLCCNDREVKGTYSWVCGMLRRGFTSNHILLYLVELELSPCLWLSEGGNNCDTLQKYRSLGTRR
jgi:hypothetical protein